MITFSLRPRSRSTPPLIALLMSTRFVFWNDAADIQLFVLSDVSVIPKTIVSAFATSPPLAFVRSFSSMSSIFSTISPGENIVVPGSLTRFRENIWRIIISMCFRAIDAPCNSYTLLISVMM